MKISLTKKILITSLLISVLFFGSFYDTNTKLTQAYALTALLFLYLSLVIDPINFFIPQVSKRVDLLIFKKGLIISTFFFAIIHFYFAFFVQLQGFNGLEFLTDVYLRSIVLGLTSLIILFIVTVISLQFIKNKLGKRINILNKFLYIAGIITIFHAIVLGTHFVELNKGIALLTIILSLILVILEIIRLDYFLKEKFKNNKFTSLPTLFLIILLTITLNKIYTSTNISVHSSHGTFGSEELGNFNANFLIDGSNIQITAYNSTTGDFAKNFIKFHGELSHLIIISEDFSEYNHLHPEFKDGVFSINFDFKKDKNYRIYFSYEPLGFVEQLNSTSVNNGVTNNIDRNNKFTENLQDYKVTLDSYSVKTENIEMSVESLKDNYEVNYIEPYLESLGHLVIVNSITYQYYHVHASELKPYEFGGPKLDFALASGKLDSGNYFAFLQFKIKDKIYTSKFNFDI